LKAFVLTEDKDLLIATDELLNRLLKLPGIETVERYDTEQ
jgi:hypothetical protein